ncbi:hypothetical protein BDA99DRAFT_538744 [Phascolomyces articulosus]|uniref:Uncharacterized protein n=1 Tax=Phascolomyces articulosus TaxID=60185 RepID=A0AAD5KAF5_9FUNG|nr:hypothetical protein BDA99DRAFT_538744 [Phascolomyces articulosus]
MIIDSGNDEQQHTLSTSSEPSDYYSININMTTVKESNVNKISFLAEQVFAIVVNSVDNVGVKVVEIVVQAHEAAKADREDDEPNTLFHYSKLKKKRRGKNRNLYQVEARCTGANRSSDGCNCDVKVNCEHRVQYLRRLSVFPIHRAPTDQQEAVTAPNITIVFFFAQMNGMSFTGKCIREIAKKKKKRIAKTEC